MKYKYLTVLLGIASFLGIYLHYSGAKSPPPFRRDFGGITIAAINTPPLPYNPNLHSASCTISAIKTTNAKGETVAQFTWTASNGTNGWISPDVGFIPALDSSVNTVQVPLIQPTTYNLVVTTGTATSSCSTTLSP